jgi:hypothetical protein
LAVARAAALTGVKQVAWREVVLPVWIYLTAILAGLIAITGLNVLSAKQPNRAWISYALWLALGIGLAAMWFSIPKQSAQSWTSWLSDWTQSKYKLHIVWLFFLGTTAIAGCWALRPNSRPDWWMHASVVCAFAGTTLSLIGVAVLIYCGGFAPLPVWTYAAIAVGQSSLAWILMMYLSLTARSRPATQMAA